jgi:hypothetical protein
MEENITFLLDEGVGEEYLDLYQLQSELNDIEIDSMKKCSGIQDDELFLEMKNYELNFTVKQLMLICEYYTIKDIKTNKLKKQDIIEQIILFESDPENIEIVTKRKELWDYMDELKNDKMMKKFVIWG